jgi:hypothetical protein
MWPAHANGKRGYTGTQINDYYEEFLLSRVLPMCILRVHEHLLVQLIIHS